MAKWSILLYVYYIFSYRKKSKYLQKKSLIFLEWSLWFSRMWEKKPNCNTYIHKYIFMSNCSIKLEGNQSTSSSRMIAAVKTYHNTSKSVTCLLLESVSGLIYPYQFKQLKSNYHNMHCEPDWWFWYENCFQCLGIESTSITSDSDIWTPILALKIIKGQKRP